MVFHTKKNILIGRDLNAYVGSKARQFTRAHDGFGFRELYEKRQSILDFSMANHLKIMHTYFKKWEEHLITYKSGTLRLQIDYFFCKEFK